MAGTYVARREPVSAGKQETAKYLGAKLPLLPITNRIGFGATSYIYPVEENNLVANVRALSTKAARIQLLFFGREYLDDLMSPAIIAELAAIHRSSGITYSVHLPMDLGIAAEPEDAANVVDRILETTMPLNPKAFILHADPYRTLEYPPFAVDSAFADAVGKGLARLERVTGGLSQRFCIENTGYDLCAVAPEILEGPWSVCFDLGHLIAANESRGPAGLHDAFERFRRFFFPRIKELHLHGARNGKDHQGLSVLSGDSFREVSAFLATYRGSAILEVFDEANLIDCIEALPALLAESNAAAILRSKRRQTQTTLRPSAGRSGNGVQAT